MNGSASAYQYSFAYIPYAYTDEDMLRSLRRYLARFLSPELLTQPTPNEGDPWIYYKPQPEGQFERPAVTIRLVSTQDALQTVRRAYHSSYTVQHTLSLMVYGDNTAPDPRLQTMQLAERVFTLLNGGGGPHYPPWRFPLWNFQAGVKVARYLHLLPGSLAMGLTDTDDLNRWYRPIDMQINAPRSRGRIPTVIIQRTGATLNAGS